MNNRKQRKALITGATGFIGPHLVKRLVKDNWNVHIIVRSHSDLDIFKDVTNRITIYKHDGNTATMNDIVNKANPNIVFHLASLFLAQHKSEDIEPLVRSNILFGTQLIEAMTTNGIKKLINTGTSWQHYNNEDYNPVCLYAATKQAFEDILKFYVETKDLKVITLKLYDTYGPDDPRPKLFNLLKRAAEEQIELAMSSGEQLIDLVYIDDVIEAYLLVAERLLSDKVNKYEDYAVSSGKPIKLKEIVETYEKVVGEKLPIEWGGRPYRDREVIVPWNKGKKIPGWKPKIGLLEGIRRMLNTRTTEFLT